MESRTRVDAWCFFSGCAKTRIESRGHVAWDCETAAHYRINGREFSEDKKWRKKKLTNVIDVLAIGGSV